jgi:threonine/homoserine/homoserine lactone efflux protein
MQDLISLAVAVVATSASGVLAPGPLFFATLSRGSNGGLRTGLRVSLGHASVELPLVVSLALGISVFIETTLLSIILGFAGGVVLLILGATQLRFRRAASRNEGTRSGFGRPFLIGVSLTLLNPFFILWWLTVGLKLIVDAFALAALGGVLFMFVTHIWMDFAWLGFVAYSGLRGQRLLGGKWFTRVIRALGIVLIMYGIYFVFAASAQFQIL